MEGSKWPLGSAALTGLYAFDFGAWTSVGYTVEEIAMLLESEQYRTGKVYQIVRADPDGRMELRGVSTDRFALEAGMFFYRSESAAAWDDFHQLVQLAERTAPPARCFVQLADRVAASGERAARLADEDVHAVRLAAPAASGSSKLVQTAPTRQVADLSDESAATRYVVALVYPAEYDEAVACWLLQHHYSGGDTVEGGISAVTNYYDEAPRILARRSFSSPSASAARSREEVFANIRLARVR